MEQHTTNEVPIDVKSELTIIVFFAIFMEHGRSQFIV